MTTELLRTRVANGAAALDLTEGVNPDWREDINLISLNLGSVTRCVLGQLFGSCDSGALRLGFEIYSDDTAVDLGFMPERDDLTGEALTEAWREYLLGSV